MVQQGVYESAVVVACGRVNDHALRLVYDEQIVILINDIERNIFSLRLVRHRIGYTNLNLVACFELLLLVGSLTVQTDTAAFNQSDSRASGNTDIRVCNELIEPYTAFGTNQRMLSHLTYPCLT